MDEVACRRWCLGLWQQRLCAHGMNERKQRLSTASANSLELLGLVCCLLCLGCLLPLSPCSRPSRLWTIRSFSSLPGHHSSDQADMEGQDFVHALETFLAIQVRPWADYPPSRLIGMHVPNGVLLAKDTPGCDLLGVLDRLVWGLGFHVLDYIPPLLLRAIHAGNRAKDRQGIGVMAPTGPGPRWCDTQ